MRLHSRFALFTMLFTLAGQVFGQQSAKPAPELAPWEGAFGIRFGQSMDIKAGKISENWSQLVFDNQPPVINRQFSTYLVFATPKAGRVYQITGSHKFGNRFDGRSVYASLAQALTAKYGPPNSVPMRAYDAYAWVHGDISIDLTWQDSAQTMSIDYANKQWKDIAASEQRELVSQNLDTKGL